MRLYAAETMIDADAATVWAVLTDLGSYQEWNPWVLACDGVAVVGEKVEVHMELRGVLRTVTHEITVVDAPTEFAWRDKAWFNALVIGRRHRHIEPLDSARCRFHQEMRIGGFLAGLTHRLYGVGMTDGIAAETDALKARAETVYRAG